MFGLLKKHCPVCGRDVDRDSSVKRFGKHFCSIIHAEKFSESNASRKEDNAQSHGGCC
jgi:endogenous inhibitor of DNA gyrase (YacG/DUF329 family)